MLNFLILVAITAIFFLIVHPKKQLGICFSGLILFIIIYYYFVYDLESGGIQFLTHYILSYSDLSSLYCFTFGLDGFSLLFFFLISFLFFTIIIYLKEDQYFLEYFLLLLITQILLFLAFSTRDLFIFYITFEAIVIPLVIFMGFGGSRERKFRAIYLFLYYTIAGSILLLISILMLFFYTKTSNIDFLSVYNLNENVKHFCFIAFTISFAIKVPTFGFHIWLPEAHVEAPTIGSVLLAGLLLKLGVYGFIRFNYGLFPDLMSVYSTPILIFTLFGVVYAGITALRQVDMKRLVAYSSVSHMNLVVCALFSNNEIGISSAVFQSLSHGFVSGSLFFLIGCLYERFHSRDINYYSGLNTIMPNFSFFLFFFLLANMAFPLTSGFVGEFTILYSIYQKSRILCVLACLTVILSGGYCLILFNKIIMGNVKSNFIKASFDLKFNEFLIMILNLIMVIWLGVFPQFFISFIEASF